MKKDQIRVIIADNHEMTRETWKLILCQHPALSVIAECTDGADVIEKAQILKPDIILMDIHMNPVNGFEATRKITQLIPSIKIICLSINNQPTYVRNMLRLGAKGYVTKSSPPEEVVEAIIEVANGRTYICRELSGSMK